MSYLWKSKDEMTLFFLNHSYASALQSGKFNRQAIYFESFEKAIDVMNLALVGVWPSQTLI